VAKQRVEVTGRHFGRDTASKAWSRIWLLPELDRPASRSLGQSRRMGDAKRQQ
jgi:hypothetical protein